MSHTYPRPLFSSVLGCPIVKKRKMEEAEAEENQASPKKRSQPLKLVMDEGFNAESDAGSEPEEKEEVLEEEEEEQKDKKSNKMKRSIEESMKGERSHLRC